MRLLVLLLLMTIALLGQELTVDPPEIWEFNCFPCLPVCDPCQIEQIDHKIHIDLVNPLFVDGVLSTESGGILIAPGIRVQAQQVIYTKHLPEEFSLYCEGDLLLNYYGHTLTGKALYYNFLTRTGMVVDGRGGDHPWYIGGEQIFLRPNGDIVLNHAYLTTSESEHKDVALRAGRILVTQKKSLTALNANARLLGIPFFYLPWFRFNIDTVSNLPLAVQFGWGGFLGTHLSMRYRALQIGSFATYARLDGYFGRGLGGGIETEYAPPCSSLTFFTRNYYAHDISLDTPQRRNRYRFEGTFFNAFWGETTTLEGRYDKVSDAQMAQQYQSDDFDLKTAGRTQAILRTQTHHWISNLQTTVRINDFQSVNQELPEYKFNLHPLNVGYGFLFESFNRLSFLDYMFADDVEGHHFRAGRFSTHPRLYRNFNFFGFSLTPEVGFIGIAYTNSRVEKPFETTPLNDGGYRGVALGEAKVSLETTLSKSYGDHCHVIKPYLHYHFLSSPTVPPGEHMIFTIADGLDRLSLLRFGVRQTLFNRCCESPLQLDLWSNAFFNPISRIQTIQKGYVDLEWSPFKRVFIAADYAYNFQERQSDFLNARTQLTVSEDFAFSIEYRSRSRFDWRKGDFYNFLLDATRPINELTNSALSDQRDIILGKVFYRINPDLFLEFEARRAWDRPYIESFFEYEIAADMVVFDHWRLNFSYEKRNVDNRYAFTLRVTP